MKFTSQIQNQYSVGWPLRRFKLSYINSRVRCPFTMSLRKRSAQCKIQRQLIELKLTFKFFSRWSEGLECREKSVNIKNATVTLNKRIICWNQMNRNREIDQPSKTMSHDFALLFSVLSAGLTTPFFFLLFFTSVLATNSEEIKTASVEDHSCVSEHKLSITNMHEAF